MKLLEFFLQYKSKNLWCRSCRSKYSTKRSQDLISSNPHSFIKGLYTIAKHNAKKRELEFSISYEELCNIYDNQLGLCAMTRVPMTYKRRCGHVDTNISTDRVDSSRGYVSGNVQFVCYVINLMKHNFTNEKLTWWANQLTSAAKSAVRPTWDQYFMNFVIAASLRSEDVKTKVGSVLVDENNKIVSTGYNGFPAKFDTSIINWKDRESVRDRIIHAEMNCLLYAGSIYSQSKLYTTKSPCSHCLKMIAAAQVKEVIYHEPYSDCDEVKTLGNDLGIIIRQVSWE